MAHIKAKITEPLIRTFVTQLLASKGIKLSWGPESGSSYNYLHVGGTDLSRQPSFCTEKSDNGLSAKTVSLGTLINAIMKIGDKPKKIVKPKTISLPIAGYDAIISKEKIVVGCQTFSPDIIDKLVSAKKEVLAP